MLYSKKLFSACVLALLAAAQGALAQDFPSRPVKLVVTLVPGATNDTIARMYAPKLTELLKQPVMVENRAGANSITGTDYVAKSAPDGHTLLFGNTTILAIGGSLFSKLPYDPKRDLLPVSLIAVAPCVLVVNPGVPARNMKELIAYAKANPNKLAYASSGTGSPFHLIGELFKAQTGIDMVHVPYKGNAPAILDLLAGQVQMLFANPPDVLGHIKGGKLRAVVSTGTNRTPLLPDVATVAEEGFKRAEALSFFAIVTPRGTPKDVIARLHSDIVKVGRLPDIRQRMIELGTEPVERTPEEAAVFINAQTEKWAKVIKDSGAKASD